MARQEYDLELRRYDGHGWCAIFFQTGFEHSLTSHAGVALHASCLGDQPRRRIDEGSVRARAATAAEFAPEGLEPASASAGSRRRRHAVQIWPTDRRRSVGVARTIALPTRSWRTRVVLHRRPVDR